MSTVDHVDATFGGRRVRFRMGPRALEWFERLHGSARATLTRFTTGNYTVADLRAVLGAAHPEKLRSGPAIEAAWAANRPATYVPLATTILVAALTVSTPNPQRSMRPLDG